MSESSSELCCCIGCGCRVEVSRFFCRAHFETLPETLAMQVRLTEKMSKQGERNEIGFLTTCLICKLYIGWKEAQLPREAVEAMIGAVWFEPPATGVFRRVAPSVN